MKSILGKLSPVLFALMVMIGIIAVLYVKVIPGDYVFTGPDKLAPAGVASGLAAHEEKTGTQLNWQPWIFSGMPTIHSFTQIGKLYYLNFIATAIKVVGLPMVWVFLLHLLFAGLGCFLLLQRLGVSFHASLLGGTGFMLMPYFNTMLVHGHGSQMMTLAYLPWVIWGLLRLYKRPTLATAALLALLVGLQLQRGHAQIAYYNLLFLGLFFLVMVVRSWRDAECSRGRTWRFIFLFAAVMVIGFGLATNLFLPVMNYTPYSIRGGQLGGGTGFEYATQWSFSIGETTTFLLPSFYGFGGITYWGSMPFTDYPNYMGILLLFLAIWAVVVKRNWFVWTLAAGGLLAYLLSLGNHFFLYKLFYNLLPYFNKFRVPSMLLVLTQFSVAVLAGIGLDALLSWLTDGKPERARRLLLGVAGGVTVLFILFLVSASVMDFPLAKRFQQEVAVQLAPQIDRLRGEMIRTDALALLIIGGLAAGGLYLWNRGRLPRKWLLGGLVVLSMVDLGRIDRQIIEPSPEESFQYGNRNIPNRSSVLEPKAYLNRFHNSDPVLDFLSSDTTSFRILPLGGLQRENRWAMVEVESVTGYHAAKLANYDRFMQATGFQSEGILRMLNVKYLVSLRRFSDPRFKEVFVGNLYTGGRYQPAAVYELSTSQDRAWFPRLVEVQATAEEIFAKLRDPGYDPQKVVYVLEDEDDTTANRLVGRSGRVLEAAWQADHIRLKVEVGEPAFLVMSEVYYPGGWRARIDGEPAPVHEVNTILRGVMVPAGSHEITMDFEPADLRLGRLISRLCLLLVALGFVPVAIEKVQARRSRPRKGAPSGKGS